MLNPCQCHSDDVEIKYDRSIDEFYVQCESCGNTGPMMEHRSEAVAEWNDNN